MFFSSTKFSLDVVIMNLEDVTTSISVNKALHSLSCAVEPTPASNLSTGRDIIDNVEYKSFKEWFHHDKSAIQRSLASLVEKYSASSSGHG